MISGVKAGDLLAVSGDFWGINHVGIIVPVWDELLVYEYTDEDRPPCLRTSREEPEGLQAHSILDFVQAVGPNVTHYPLRRPLYLAEMDRLTPVIDAGLGRGPEMWGGIGTGANIIAHAYQQIGLWAAPPQLWTPKKLVKALERAGIIEISVAAP